MSKAKESGKASAAEVEAGERFAAKLLFQFRVMVGGDPGVMRTCEERIIVFRAVTARKALAYAKQRGRSAKRQSRNSDGNAIHFEFVGVLDLIHLGDECDADEVWYDITTRKLPMERAASLIPPEHTLSAIRFGT